VNYMKYLIAGPAIVNDIFSGGRLIMRSVPGGSVYCLAGIKLWSDSCLFVADVGDDFETYYGKWMDDNGMSRAGLSKVLPHTWYSALVYGEHGLHSEHSVYDDDRDALDNFNNVVRAGPIAAACAADTEGIYVEASETAPLWENICLIREVSRAKIMWELPTSAALTPSRRDGVMAALAKADAYTVNLPEARSLFGTSSDQSAIEAVALLGKPCFLRAGKRGAYFIDERGAAFADSVSLGSVVDSTGCGNASTAAALYAWCAGFDGRSIAKIANISAAFNTLQYGPYPKTGLEERRLAQRLLAEK
jgi:sugar/nucleoside kinase (ribokinase family)